MTDPADRADPTPPFAGAPGDHEVGADDRVLPATRVLAIAFVLLLIPAFVVLYFWPSADDTARLFSWRVAPSFTSMFLASVYLGGIYYFARTAVAKEWHRVGTGFVAVACFAALMGLATLLHWDRFIHANLAFWLWAPLYWITPFWAIAVWLLNRRRDPRSGPELISPRTAAFMGAVGVAATITGVFLFAFPGTAIAVWPWPLTELTARIVGACFVLGLSATAALTDRRWSSFRVLLQSEGVILLLILIAVARAPADFSPSKPMTWAFAVGSVALAAASLALYVRMERVSRRGPEARAPLAAPR